MKENRSKTRTQIAAEYGVSARTLSRWLQRNNLSVSPGLICPKEQARIYQNFGHPMAVGRR